MADMAFDPTKDAYVFFLGKGKFEFVGFVGSDYFSEEIEIEEISDGDSLAKRIQGAFNTPYDDPKNFEIRFPATSSRHVAQGPFQVLVVQRLEKEDGEHPRKLILPCPIAHAFIGLCGLGCLMHGLKKIKNLAGIERDG
jgi:hypothetical protein